MVPFPYHSCAEKVAYESSFFQQVACTCCRSRFSPYVRSHKDRCSHCSAIYRFIPCPSRSASEVWELKLNQALFICFALYPRYSLHCTFLFPCLLWSRVPMLSPRTWDVAWHIAYKNSGTLFCLFSGMLSWFYLEPLRLYAQPSYTAGQVSGYSWRSLQCPSPP